MSASSSTELGKPEIAEVGQPRRRLPAASQRLIGSRGAGKTSALEAEVDLALLEGKSVYDAGRGEVLGENARPVNPNVAGQLSATIFRGFDGIWPDPE